MAGFLKRFFGHFGLFKDSNHLDEGSADTPPSGFPSVATRAVLRERKVLAPVVSQCTYGAGGVQGLQWYADKLMMDEDGDVAQEFLNEVVAQPLAGGGTCAASNFEVKLPTKPVKLKGPLCTSNGNVHQFIESSTGVHWS